MHTIWVLIHFISFISEAIYLLFLVYLGWLDDYDAIGDSCPSVLVMYNSPGYAYHPHKSNKLEHQQAPKLKIWENKLTRQKLNYSKKLRTYVKFKNYKYISLEIIKIKLRLLS